MEEEAAREAALFEHLQDLMDALPAMEEKGRTLTRARGAVEVADAARRLRGQTAMLGHVDEDMTLHVQAREQAIVEGDAQAEERERAQILLLGNQRGVRAGAEQSARLDLERALQQTGFATEDEARAAELSPSDMADLEAEVAEFQRDFATTLAACQQVEGIAEEEESNQP